MKFRGGYFRGGGIWSLFFCFKANPVQLAIRTFASD